MNKNNDCFSSQLFNLGDNSEDDMDDCNVQKNKSQKQYVIY